MATRTNLATNPSGETGVTGWTDWRSTIASVTDDAYVGTHCFELTRDAGGDDTTYLTITIAAGEPLSLQFAVKGIGSSITSLGWQDAMPYYVEFLGYTQSGQTFRYSDKYVHLSSPVAGTIVYGQWGFVTDSSPADD